MGLKLVRCTTCGYQMKIDLERKQHTCEACGNTFVSDIGAELNKSDFDKEKLKNLRENLDNAIMANDINAILHFSQNILVIIPKDFTALYYNAYASSKLVSPLSLHKFLKGIDYKATEEELEAVVIHISNNIELRDFRLGQEFVSMNHPKQISIYEEIIQKRIEIEDNYAMIERDVFVCHRSTDCNIASQLVEELESDGNTCWISSRNLRPDDNESYWKNIREAIENCSIFLVVSSQDAMLSKDIREELSIARRFNKSRIEFKIDDSVHTTLFKHFFDGYKWINAIHNKKEAIVELRDRVLDIQLNQKDNDSENSEDPRINNLVEKMYFDIEIEAYDNAKITIEKIQDNNYKNIDSWIGLLLIEHNQTSVEGFIRYIRKIESKNELSRISKSQSFQAVFRINRDNNIIKSIIKEIDKRKEIIQKLENTYKEQDSLEISNQPEESPIDNSSRTTKKHYKEDKATLVAKAKVSYWPWLVPFLNINKLANYTNTICVDDGKKTSGIETYVLLIIITCGLYWFIWPILILNRWNNYLSRCSKATIITAGKYVAWWTFGLMLFYLGPFIAESKFLNTYNKVLDSYYSDNR